MPDVALLLRFPGQLLGRTRYTFDSLTLRLRRTYLRFALSARMMHVAIVVSDNGGQISAISHSHRYSPQAQVKPSLVAAKESPPRFEFVPLQVDGYRWLDFTADYQSGTLCRLSIKRSTTSSCERRSHKVPGG